MVPVDYTHPHGAEAHLALNRIPATGTRIGSLVINPGGPGESRLDTAVSVTESLPAEIRQQFDLVEFDPRGVGSSTPALRCNSNPDDDARRTDPQVFMTQDTRVCSTWSSGTHPARSAETRGEQLVTDDA